MGLNKVVESKKHLKQIRKSRTRSVSGVGIRVLKENNKLTLTTSSTTSNNNIISSSTTSSSAAFNNHLKIFGNLNQKPNGSSLDNRIMAPALTEPLRSANQLTSSSSPNARPHTPTPTNLNQCGFMKLGLMNEPTATETTIITPTTTATTTNIVTTPTTSSSSMGTNNLENLIDDIPISFDFEEAIEAEICMKGGGSTSTVDHMDFMKNVEPPHTSIDDKLQDEEAVVAVISSEIDKLPISGDVVQQVVVTPPPSLASQHNIGSEEKLIGFDLKELNRISTDSTVTVTASECNDLDVEDNLSQLDTQSSQSPTKCLQSGGSQSKDNSQAVDMDLGDIDLLNVFKNLESNTENLTDLAGSLSIFNDVDINYEYELSSSVPNTNSTSPTYTSETKEIQGEIKKMGRQIDFLVRRLRKLQARSMSKQSCEEISGLFEWSNRITRRKEYEATRRADYEEETQRPVSASSMRTVLKKIETVAVQQRSIPSKKKQVGRPANIVGPAVTTPKHPPLSTLVPPFDSRTIEEMAQVAGSLRSELRIVEHGLDSDATLSSSGGESADENITYSNTTQQAIPISRRAAWRYCKDRAAIASRWTWLAAQISDLEFKRRQHEEILQKIKIGKGSVKLEPPVSLDMNQSDMDSVHTDCEDEGGSCRTRPLDRKTFRKRKLLQTANVHNISNKLAKPSNIKCGCQWPMHPCAVCTGRPDPTAPRDLPDTMLMQDRIALLDNGYHPVLSFPEDRPYAIVFEATANCFEWRSKCLRCTAKSAIKNVIAAQKAAFKQAPQDKTKKNADGVPKRKYKKKAQQPPPQQLVDMYSDDGAAVSGSSTPLAANKVKNSKRQNNNHRLNHTTNNTINHHHHHHHSIDGYNQGQHQGASSSTYHPNLNSTIPMSSSAAAGGGGHSLNHPKNKIRKISSSTSFLNNNSANLSNNGNLYGGNDSSYDQFIDGSLNGYRSRNSSPTHSYYGNYYKSERSERKSRNSYDIDNIVIPYSVAATTRVELLPYKEIPTPKWRMIDDDDFLLNPDEANEIMNDLDKNSFDKLFDDFVALGPDDKPDGNMDGLLNSPSLSTSSACDITKTPNNCVIDEPTTIPPFPDESPIINNNMSPAEDDDDQLHHNTQLPFSPQHKSSVDLDESKESSKGSLEDTSDEVYSSRHERLLIDERKRFATYLKFPFSTRSRANRRVDSRTESSGANTPDPSSPATTTTTSIPNLPPIGEQESISSPSTPQTPFECIENDSNSILAPVENKKRNERKRTTSSKKDRERSSTPDLREIIPPFDPLQFPLADELYEEMLKLMPADHQTLNEFLDTPESLSKDGNPLVDNLGFRANPENGGDTGEQQHHHHQHHTNTDLIDTNRQHYDYVNQAATILDPTGGGKLMDDSETDSVDTITGEDDPNDPEWKGDSLQ